MEHTFDAKNENLGRLATKIADILQGKDDPNYQPNKVADNKIIVKNIDKIKITGKKFDQKIYYHHTGYMGHLKERTYKQVFARSPEKVLEHAVKGMLPKNFLRDRRMNNLIIEKSVKDKVNNE